MFAPRAFAVRDKVSLVDELRCEREGIFVQMNALARLSENADRAEKNRNCDESNELRF